MLRLRWRPQFHAVAGARLHQRIGERRAPAKVAAVEIYLDNDVVSSAQVLDTLSQVVSVLPQTGSVCTDAAVTTD